MTDHFVLPPPDTPPSRILECSDMADLIRIFEPHLQVLRLRRQPQQEIVADLEDRSATVLGGGFRQSLSAEVGIAADELARLGMHGAFKADVIRLIELYGDLVGSPRIGIRCEILEKAMCPRFHVDSVGIRMLCTYRGQATEWLDRDWSEWSARAQFADGLHEEESLALEEPATMGRAAPFDIVLLKGCLWPGNETRGAIHRSPKVSREETPRMLLSLDALWDEE
jgi:hypothetical protein